MKQIGFIESPSYRPRIAPKGQNMTAQGIALGTDWQYPVPCRGNTFCFAMVTQLDLFALGPYFGMLHSSCFALSGLFLLLHNFPGRCPGLFCFALSGPLLM